MVHSIQANAARELYENLGKLFYAIAAADKIVSKEEIRVLYEIVEKEWVPVEDSSDEYGTDLSFQIEVIFDWYKDNDFSAEAAYEKFETYQKEHTGLFDADLNDLIWKTANSIAQAFPGKNRSEILMLIRLKSLLHIHNMVSHVCQSCGLPLQEENYGTYRNAAFNDDYCNACFRDGEFTDHSLTLHKLETQLEENVAHHNSISFEEAERLKKVLPTLKRWRMSRI